MIGIGAGPADRRPGARLPRPARHLRRPRRRASSSATPTSATQMIEGVEAFAEDVRDAPLPGAGARLHDGPGRVRAPARAHARNARRTLYGRLQPRRHRTLGVVRGLGRLAHPCIEGEVPNASFSLPSPAMVVARASRCSCRWAGSAYAPRDHRQEHQERHGHERGHPQPLADRQATCARTASAAARSRSRRLGTVPERLPGRRRGPLRGRERRRPGRARPRTSARPRAPPRVATR